MNTKAERFKKEGYNICCMPFLEKLDIPKGLDLADILL
jgi:hypothetical protein